MLKYIREEYEITNDRKGEKFLGLTIKGDYVNINVHVSIPR